MLLRLALERRDISCPLHFGEAHEVDLADHGASRIQTTNVLQWGRRMTTALASLIDTNSVSETIQHGPSRGSPSFSMRSGATASDSSQSPPMRTQATSAVCPPAIAEMAVSADSTILSTNCSRIGSSIGPLSAPARAHR